MERITKGEKWQEKYDAQIHELQHALLSDIDDDDD